jgi:(4-(4-[2-(gamma-L-glutamylamino)ethyl]phenoxymethyl)furan-2-yl)methanamine synthase
MCPLGVLGLDVGGANLKVAHSSGVARTRPFPLWQNPAALPDVLTVLVQSMPPADQFAVTMTGELCDCFESKRQGVGVILDAVNHVAGQTPVRVWCTDGRFREPVEARAVPLLAAAGNWLALGTFTGRFAPSGPALLIDAGSTTTDIVPLLDGRPVPGGRSDPERLRSRELIYTGVRRTPVCALLGHDGAGELFATTLDVYLVLGELAEEPQRHDTADGRPATRAAAHARLARMLCADLETSTEQERVTLARQVAQRQRDVVANGIAIVAPVLPGEPGTIVIAGSGAFLAERAWQVVAESTCRLIRLHEVLGLEISQAACAYAVAVLAAEA